LKALDKDPAKCSGVCTIHQKIAFDDNIHLTQYSDLCLLCELLCLLMFFTRDFVSEVMHIHDNDAFAAHEPTAKRTFCVKKYSTGTHQCWAADGHDKLYKIGFPIWAIVDDATGKWLGAWVVPSNQTGNIVAYLWLCTVQKYGGKQIIFIMLIAPYTFIGMLLQFTTDCGAETTVVYGLVNAFQ